MYVCFMPNKDNVMLCYVMLCYVMLCYVMLCYVMIYIRHMKQVQKGEYNGILP